MTNQVFPDAASTPVGQRGWTVQDPGTGADQGLTGVAGFTTSGTLPLGGATTATFDVRRFGAVCDGATDDTAAVIAAYSAANGTGIVTFPPGTTTCVQGNINPAGAPTWGLGATVKFLNGITPTHAMFTPAGACSFYGLTFDLNSANTTNPANLNQGAAIYAVNSAGWSGTIRISRCTVMNGWQCGIAFYTTGQTNALNVSASAFAVTDCEIFGNGKIGVYLNEVSDGVVSNNFIHNNGTSGIYENVSLRNRFTSNSCVANTSDGIVSVYSYGTLVTGNNCTDNGNSGIVIGGGSTTVAAGTHFTITGNTCRNNGHTVPGHGIDIDTTLTGGPTTPVPAYGSISGNTCDSNVDHGIYVNNSQYVSVTGNVCNSNGLDGIILTAQNASVSGNILTGNTNGLGINNGGGHQLGSNYIAGNSSHQIYDIGSIASVYTPAGVVSPGGTSSYLRADGNWGTPATSTAGAVLGTCQYAPATLAHFQTSSVTIAPMDTAHLTVSFTAPASGNIMVILSACAAAPSTAVEVVWALTDHTSGAIYGNQQSVCQTTAPNHYTVQVMVSGLTPGTVYQMDWAQGSSTASSQVTTYAMGVSSLTASPSNHSPATMTVFSL